VRIVDEILGFFESSPELITVSAAKLRSTHGDGFNIKVLNILLNLRVDIPNSDKKEIFESCRSVLSKQKDPMSDSLK